MIVTEQLTKIYRTYRKEPGLWGAVKGLGSRKYDETRAADGVSFKIEEGEFVGFLGPNGAGKTTVLKMLSGLLNPTSGKATVLGFTPWERKDEMKRQFALLMGQKNALWWDLPARESMELNRAIYGIDRKKFEQIVGGMSELLDVTDKLNVMVRELSLGERMKCELTAALLHRPKVLFLDEPTIGLDVDMQVTVREFIKAYNERFGATVLLTSHYMADVLALCPRIIVIDKGRPLFDGALQELVHSVRPEKRIILKLSKPVDRADAEAIGDVVEHDPGRLVLQVRPDRVLQAIGGAMARLPVADLVVEDPPLEDVLRDLFERSRVEARA